MKLKIFSPILFLLLISNFDVIFAVENRPDDENAQIEVVEWEDVPNYWVVKWGSRRGMFEKAKRSKGGCVVIGFIIESDGNSSSHRIIGSFPDDALDEVMLDYVQRAHFKPAKSNVSNMPVYTVFPTAMYNVRNGKMDEQLIIKVNKICKRKADNYLTQLIQNQAD